MQDWAKPPMSRITFAVSARSSSAFNRLGASIGSTRSPNQDVPAVTPRNAACAFAIYLFARRCRLAHHVGKAVQKVVVVRTAYKSQTISNRKNHIYILYL